MCGVAEETQAVLVVGGKRRVHFEESPNIWIG
jgi:hypothetical protein